MKHLLMLPILLNLLFGLNTSMKDSISTTTNEIRFYSDVTIDTAEVMTDNIRILGGQLNVYGIVKSQITVIGGDVNLYSTSVIEGKIVAIGGDVKTAEGATITGKVVEASMDQGLIYRETFSDSSIASGDQSFIISTFSHRHRDGWVHPEPDIFVYNRNEGLRFTPINWNWDRGNESLIRLSFSAGYRTAPNEFIGRTTLETSLLANRTITLFASGFKEARTDDDFRLPLDENTWANILAKQDFYDRWDEQGVELGFGVDLSRLKIKGRFARSTQSEIPMLENVWSLFNEERPHRESLTLPETDVEYLEGIVAFRTHHYSPLNPGIATLSKIELTLNEHNVSLDTPTLRMSHMAIMNWPLSKGVLTRHRVLVGMGSDSLQSHRQFGVGGLGSVSAYDYKTQSGNQMAQYNTELIFTEDFTESWFMVKLFYDAGIAYTSSDLMDLGYITDHSDEIIQSAGLGFGWDDGDGLDIGFNFAKQLNSNEPIETTVRLNFNF